MELTPGENTLLFHEGHDDEDYEHEDMASMPLDEEHPMWRSERISLNSVDRKSVV